MELPYDGTLLTLVQLWNSSFRLNTFSKVMIPTCPLEGAPLMTREYVNLQPSQRIKTSQGNLCIIFKKRKPNVVSPSSKQASEQPKEKLHLPYKCQEKSNDTLHVSKTSSMSKTLKDGDVCVCEIKIQVPHLILKGDFTSFQSWSWFLYNI